MDTRFGDGSQLPYIRDYTMADSGSFFNEAFPSDILDEDALNDTLLDNGPAKEDSIQNSSRGTSVPCNSASSPEGSAHDSSDDISTSCDYNASLSPPLASAVHNVHISDVVRPSNWRGGRIDQPHNGRSHEQDLELSNKVMESQFDFESAANSPSPFATGNTPASAKAGRYVAIPRDSASPRSLNTFPSNTDFNRGRPIYPASNANQLLSPGPISGSPDHDVMDMTYVNGSMPALVQSLEEYNSQPVTMPPQQMFNIHPQSQSPTVNVWFDSLKTRVETQINARLALFPAPKGIKRLRLPEYAIGKAKLFAVDEPRGAKDTLELSTTVVCVSAMHDPQKLQYAMNMAAVGSGPAFNAFQKLKPLDGGPVAICSACIERERKRSHRKKVKEADEEARFLDLETKRIVIFNTAEIQEWNAPAESPQVGKPQKARAKATTTEAAPAAPNLPSDALQIELPTRIPCYGRHHGETEGFRVIFTIRDHTGAVVAQNISPRLIITDDHKEKKEPSQSHSFARSPPSMQANYLHGMPTSLGPHRNALSTSDLHALQTLPDFRQANTVAFVAPQGLRGGFVASGTNSRQVSPSANDHRSKKRKSSSGAIVPEELRMTSMARAEPSPPATWAPITSPITNLSPFSTDFPPVANSVQMTGDYTSSPPTSNGDMFSPITAGHQSTFAPQHRPTHSLPGSAHGSRAASPSASRVRQSSSGDVPNGQAQAARFAGNMWSDVPGPNILKVLPPSGPLGGGIEISIVGHDFHHGLQVMFGDCPAVTKYIGPNALVCTLPPAYLAGTVNVTLMNTAKAARSHVAPTQWEVRLFTYESDEEEAGIKLALQMLARKKGTNLRDLLGQILGADQGYHADMNMDTSGGGTHDNGLQDSEGSILQILELIDLADSELETDLNLQRDNGQGLLHIAASLGFIRLVAGLLARGANADLTDRNGNTPMHLAAMHGHSLVVRKLRTAKADSELRTLRGFTPADMATTPEVLAILCPPRSRSQSIQSNPLLHSRNSSLSALSARGLSLARKESHHDTAVDGDDEASTTQGFESDHGGLEMSWPRSRRNSSGASQSLGTDAAEGGSLLAWRDSILVQIQHYQEMASRSFPNLQLPNFPAMPNIPENYQAALRSFVPRSGASSDGESPSSAKEGRFRLFDSMWSPPAALTPRSDPPAYSDLFPSESAHDHDTKIASAVQAAADAAADQKCSTLYDQQASSSSMTTLRETKFLEQPSIRARGVHPPLTIGGLEATPEQLKNIRAARAERQKGLKKDVKLFVFWIPVLLLIVCAVIADQAPYAIRVTKEAYESFVNSFVGSSRQIRELQAAEV